MELVAIARHELYELVWSMPMRDAAATIPMSDRGLKKVCQRHNVPVPPQGYWNKLQAGHAVEQTPLPPLEAGASDEVVIFEPGHVAFVRNRAEEASERTPEEWAARDKQKRAAEDARYVARAAARREVAEALAPEPDERSTEDDVYYVVRIESWKWDYHFGINDAPELSPKIFADHRQLRVYGTPSRPTAVAGGVVELCFVPSDIQRHEHRSRRRPDRIGPWWRDDKTQEHRAVLSMPEDILPSLLPMLLAEQFGYVVLNGGPLVDGEAAIRSYRFARTIALDELPPEE